MKKRTWVLILTILFAGTALVSAEGMKDGMMGKGMKGGMMGEGMMKGGMMDKGGMMGMHGMMMKMMEKSVVATSDGGVVVVVANKMSKYDKNLNLVKEVELKMPTMEEMQKMCPMMGQGMAEGKEPSAAAEKTAPAEEIDHASHH